MALTITKLKMWKDPGYTRRCVEVPPAGSKKLPAVADYVLATGKTLRPEKGSILTSVELPLSYSQLFDMSYLYMEAGDGNGTIKLFGWVDKIEMTASSGDAVRIDWTPDWWRSYSGTVTFGPGTLTRCSDASLKRAYPVSPRYKKIDTITELTPFTAGGNTVWVIAVGTQSSGNVNDQLKYYYSPIGTYFKVTGDNNTYTGVTFPDIMRTLLEIMNNQSPRVSLLAVYLSTVSPVPMTWDSGSSTWTMEAGYTAEATLFNAGAYNACIQFDPWLTSNYQTITIDSSADGAKANDTTDYIVTDYSGNIQATLPYGIGFKNALIRLSLGVNGSYLDVNFTNDANGFNDYSDATKGAKTFLNSLTGFRVSIPLPRVTMTEDQYSEYIVSGQRDYDLENTRVQREQTAVKGLTGVGMSTAGGAISGAMIGSAPGAVAGAVIGGAGSIAGTGINYLTDEYYSDRLQRARDHLYANQRNGVILSGDNNDFLLTTVSMNAKSGPMLVKMVSDSTSELEYNNDVSWNGYECELSVGSVATYIATGGPIQVTNLVVTGNAPPQAKQAIKIMLENGIRIVENNPSGVSP